MTELALGTRVVDRDGYRGTVVNVTHHNGSIWYDVRLPGGVAVRYPEDLTVEAPFATNRPGDMAAAYAEETGIDYSTALRHCNMD